MTRRKAQHVRDDVQRDHPSLDRSRIAAISLRAVTAQWAPVGPS